MKVNNISFRDSRKSEKTGAPYSLVDVDFEIGNETFHTTFAVFAMNITDGLDKIKSEIGKYIVHLLFKNYNDLEKLKG